MLQFLKVNGCNKVLNDGSKLKGNWTEAAEWAKTEWLPLAIEAGLKYFAWVYPPHVFSQLGADMAIDEMKREISARLFADPHEAEQWLDAFPPYNHLPEVSDKVPA